MTDRRTHPEPAPLTKEELDEIRGEPLPERAAMSIVNANLAMPINAAVALNALSDDSLAFGTADQETPTDQADQAPPPDGPPRR